MIAISNAVIARSKELHYIVMQFTIHMTLINQELQ